MRGAPRVRHAWSPFALSTSVLVAITLVACATATGDVTIAPEKFDAAKPPAPEAACAIESGSGTKWSDLHRDLFGPTSRPGSCSYKSNCHGTADQSGAKTSNGFVCGADKAECRSNLIKTNLVNDLDKAAPEKSSLIAGILRVRNPAGDVVGIMPQEPSNCVYSDASLERIKTWIRNGIPDD
jgi:hypothetical protein